MTNIAVNLFQQKNPVSFGLSKDRRPVVIGNHKSGVTKQQEYSFILQFTKSVSDFKKANKGASMPEIIVAPSAPYYDLYGRNIAYSDMPQFALAGQNCLWEGEDPIYHKEWPVTGELTVEQLKSCGVKYVFVGHVERKDFLDENCLQINAKVKAVLSSKDNKIFPIICLRENFELKDNSSETNKYIANQLANYLTGVKKEDFKKL